MNPQVLVSSTRSGNEAVAAGRLPLSRGLVSPSQTFQVPVKGSSSHCSPLPPSSPSSDEQHPRAAPFLSLTVQSRVFADPSS